MVEQRRQCNILQRYDWKQKSTHRTAAYHVFAIRFVRIVFLPCEILNFNCIFPKIEQWCCVLGISSQNMIWVGTQKKLHVWKTKTKLEYPPSTLATIYTFDIAFLAQLLLPLRRCRIANLYSFLCIMLFEYAMDEKINGLAFSMLTQKRTKADTTVQCTVYVHFPCCFCFDCHILLLTDGVIVAGRWYDPIQANKTDEKRKKRIQRWSCITIWHKIRHIVHFICILRRCSSFMKTERECVCVSESKSWAKELHTAPVRLSSLCPLIFMHSFCC